MQSRRKKPVAANTEENFALYEMQHALTDGLFEPVHKVKDAEFHFRAVTRRTKIRWKNNQGEVVEEDITFRFLIPLTLSTQTESILLGIVKLAGIDGIKTELSEETSIMFESVKEDARDRARSKIICKQYQLLKASGMPDGKRSYQQLEFHLTQMARVTIEWLNHTSGWRGVSHLIDYTTNDDGNLLICLNWRLAGAIFSDYYRAVINLDERHALKKDASKTLHRWLSAHIWTGKSDYLLYDTLISHIWSQKTTCTAQKMRLSRLKNEVLPEIASLDRWKVETDTRGAKITHLGK